MTAYMFSISPNPKGMELVFGIGLGSILGAVLIGLDYLFRKFQLRSFNITILGLFFGYLMGEALVLIFNKILLISSPSIFLDNSTIETIKIILFIFGIYFGTIMTLKSADEIHLSIPFIKFSPALRKKRDLLMDSSALMDPRIIDLASSGLIDHHIVLPRFITKELYTQAETAEEALKAKARRCLDTIKKLEEITEVRYNDTDFSEIKDITGKLIKLARLLDANIISSEIGKTQASSLEGIKIINLNVLANALKPLTQSGESLKIKIQRYGKEPNQGVGYLEDGTMVVVNGGGNFIGETIEAQVLSVKHSVSGRIIFCNSMDAQFEPEFNR